MNLVALLARSPEYLLHPLLNYALMAVGLGLCLYLFMTLKVELRGLQPGRVGDQQRVEALESALEEARLAVKKLENRSARSGAADRNAGGAFTGPIGDEPEQAHAGSAPAPLG